MLTYQPQNDIYYGIFRFLSILTRDSSKEYNVDLFKILDFYFLFPNFIPDIRVTSELLKDKNKFKLYKNAYAIEGNQKQIFHKLNKIQDKIIEILVTKNILNIAKIKIDIISLNPNTDIPFFLLQQIEAKNHENYNLLEFLTKLYTLPFYGEDGLKDRTGLMEYRYDGVN